MVRRALVAAALGLTLVGLGGTARAAASDVMLVELDGAVDPLTARYVERALDEASQRGSAAVVLRIDTPGGLDSSMRQIVRAVGNARVPVACWVGPSGARAASAGAIITLGCPVAAMASGSNIGAAHPVGFRGEILSEKITNDAAAYARALAQRWGRDGAVAEAMVRRSLSLSARDAVARGVVDLLAEDIASLLRTLDGRSARADPFSGSGAKTFDTAERDVVSYDMSFIESLLHGAVDPDLAYLLLLLGLLGIGVEVLTPGIGVAGLGGAASLLVAMPILGMLPVNLVGVLLIVLGVALFIAEAYIPGGVAAAGGAVALVLGGLFLFDAAIPAARVSRGLLIGTVVAVAAFFLFAMRAVLRSMKQRPTSPTTDELIGETGIVQRPLDPLGIVRVRNEEWSARAGKGLVIGSGIEVRIVEVDGLTLTVEPVAAPTETTTEVKTT